MPRSRRDPYAVLGVSARASDQEVRAAYRRLVQRHHPDHNGGSAEATRRFEEIQAAYAEIRDRRASGRDRAAATGGTRSDPDLEQRLAELERRLREARAARDQALRAAARERMARRPRRPSDEELGYVHTDDSFSKILDDAAEELSHRAREHPMGKRLADWIDKLSDDPPRK